MNKLNCLYFTRKNNTNWDYSIYDNPLIDSFASSLCYQSVKRIKKIINQSLKYKSDNLKLTDVEVDLTEKLPIEIYYLIKIILLS